MAKNENKMNLPKITVDDLFSTQEERDSVNQEKVIDISIRDISDFPEHPFKVLNNTEMEELSNSINDVGVLVPAIVRKKDDGKYEMISGHRRMHAAQLIGLKTIPAIVREMTNDEAVIFMVDANIQREEILPSEKAFAYKMRLEAVNRKAGRPSKDNLTPVVSELRTNELLGKEVGESREQIRRYIRLTELIPEILEMVDEGQIAMRPAVEISYFPKKLQKSLLMNMEREACTPSHDQTIRMRRLLREDKLTPESIAAIMQEEKPNQKDKVVLKSTRVASLFPKDLPITQREDYVVKAMEHYNRYLKRQREMDMER